MSSEAKDIYSPKYIKSLFDSMSKTYSIANYISSFGFSERWRKQCIKDLPPIPDNALGYDLMSGMGESWKYILKQIGNGGKLIAVDISTEMNKQANAYIKKKQLNTVQLKPTNILENDIVSESADFITSCFGIKTFNLQQTQKLASEIERILKPNGSFAFVEISEPQGWALNWLYMFYLEIAIPIIGKVFLGNATDYKMLGIYCKNFKDSSRFHQFLLDKGLQSNFKKYFFGCATVVYGTK